MTLNEGLVLTAMVCHCFLEEVIEENERFFEKADF